MICDGGADDIDSVGLGCALEAFGEYNEVLKLIKSLPDVYSDNVQSEYTYQSFVYILNQYQEQPHLLDKHITTFLEELILIVRNTENDNRLRHLAFKLMYIITKVRGFKTVVKHLPHEVSDLEPVLAYINEQDPHDCETWETRYMLLLWMSIVVMIPFHMSRLDNVGDEKESVMKRVLDVIKKYLSVGDKAGDAAAFLASRFVVRPDVKQVYLKEYLDWCLQVLSSIDKTMLSGVALQAGILSSLALLFKHGEREDLCEYGIPVLTTVLEHGFTNSKSTVVRKMAIKLVQRVGLSFLRIKIAKWRYSRGTRSLTDNLSKGDTIMKLANLDELAPEQRDPEEEDGYEIPDEMEDVIEQLLVGLRDKDTVLRWSAAKGIGRITSRLPQELADDVVTSVLGLFSLRESDSAWHGGCLALAELGRRGLIVPEHLSKVVSVVLKALVYDELKGNFSVGAHIRDAACYVCWSFARAYDPKDLQCHVNSIAGALLVTAIFDREVNCRRAASAAFQENVGRQGTFPHGIDILTVADYYAVGSRTNAFLNLSAFIGQFSEYSMTLIDHLLEHKVNHWDSAIRHLASKALYKLTLQNSNYVLGAILPKLLQWTVGTDLNGRHGALLASGEVIHALSTVVVQSSSKLSEMLGDSMLADIRDIAFTLDEKKFFRGLGGVFTRCGICALIEKASVAELPFHKDDTLIKCWQEIIDSSLKHMDASVRSAAGSALLQFCTRYMSLEARESTTLLASYRMQLKADHLESRCGAALALSSLPDFILKQDVAGVVNDLSECASVSSGNPSWADARRDAIKALGDIVEIVGISSCDVDVLYRTLFEAMGDYTVDSRGEVGAIVREAAMVSLQKITSLVSEENLSALNENLLRDTFAHILLQCTEKIDRTRSVAGGVFSSLLHNEKLHPFIPHCERLLEVFPKSVCDHIIWAAPSETCHLFVKLLPLKEFTYNLLIGFTVSVGGLTESLVKHSRLALVGYLNSMEEEERRAVDIAGTFLNILRNNAKNDRILIPFFKTVDYLLVSGVTLKDDPDYNEELISLVWQASYKSSDLPKLYAAVDLFCDTLQFDGSIFKLSLSKLMVFLCHRFPRVRVATANKMYEAFVSYDILPDANAPILDLLTETNWNDPVSVLRPIRNKLCECLGMPVPLDPVLRKNCR